MNALIERTATQALAHCAVTTVNPVGCGPMVAKEGGNTMRHLCGALLAFWTIGLIPVAIFFCLNLSWDHSFGHPPVGAWIFTAVYMLAGFGLWKGAYRNPAKAPNVEA